jgi:hypothetical protein
MSRRYVTAWPGQWWAPDNLARPTMTVVEREPAAPIDTGILAADGRKIWAVIERDPIGFVHFD